MGMMITKGLSVKTLGLWGEWGGNEGELMGGTFHFIAKRVPEKNNKNSTIIKIHGMKSNTL